MYLFAYRRLQVDVHIDSRKLTMQLTDRDTPTSATERFLKNNAISSKWRSQITSKVQQALLDIHNEDHQYHWQYSQKLQSLTYVQL